MTQKTVLTVDVHDEKEKQKAMKAVTSLLGIDSIAMDMKANKMTVIGCVNPVDVVGKLEKKWNGKILTVGPAKEPEKKKDEAKYCNGCHTYYTQYNPCYAGCFFRK